MNKTTHQALRLPIKMVKRMFTLLLKVKYSEFSFMVNIGKLTISSPVTEIPHRGLKKGNWLAIVLFSLPLQAQVVTDGTLGATVTLNGQDITITQDLGTLQGSNLFHSFQTFNIQQNGSATFTGANNINNVISRVTGGDISNFNGVLRSEVGQANFFFINPAGVVFGAGANVDVPASFHVSTADELRFEDGTVFSATNPDISSLTIASPESFGFLGLNQSSITMYQPQLDFKPDTDVSIVSGDITIQGFGTLDVNNVDLRVIAQGDEASIVPFNADGVNLATGSLSVSDIGIYNFGDRGNLFFHAGDLSITDDSVIASWNPGDASTNGADIELIAGDLSISNGSFISSDSFDGGRGGTIRIVGEKIEIDGNGLNTSIFSEAEQGAGGAIELTANELTIVNGGNIGGGRTENGDGGLIEIDAGTILIDRQGSELFTGIKNAAEGTGAGGNIELNTGELAIVNGGEISGSSTAEGNAGSVIIKAGRVMINGQESPRFTGISGTANATGAGAIIDVTSNELMVLNGGRISGSSFGEGNGGQIFVNAELLVIDEQEAYLLRPDIKTGIYSEAKSSGSGGNIAVSASSLAVVNGGRISGSSFGEGDAGTIIVDTDQLKIAELSSIVSLAFGSGAGGDIAVTARSSLALVSDGEIRGGSFGDGDAGTVTVKADQLMIDGQGSPAAGIFSEAELTGAGGNIVVTANEMSIVGGGRISGRTEGEGDAGAIFVIAEQLFIDGEGDGEEGPEIETGIFSDAEYSGAGGEITVRAKSLTIVNGGGITGSSDAEGGSGTISIKADDVVLLNGRITTSAEGANTNGGPISILSNVLVLKSGFIQANAESAQGGEITIDTNAVVAYSNKVLVGGEDRVMFENDGPNVVQAVAPDGVSGLVNINAPEIDISGSLLALDPSFADITGLAFDPCAAFVSGAPSTFTVLGRGGLPGSFKSDTSLSLTEELLTELLDDDNQQDNLKAFNRINPIDLSLPNYSKAVLPNSAVHKMVTEC